MRRGREQGREVDLSMCLWFVWPPGGWGEGHLLFTPPGPELRDSPLCLDLQTGEGEFSGADRTAGAGPQMQGPALLLLPHLALPEDHKTQAAGPGVTPNSALRSAGLLCPGPLSLQLPAGILGNPFVKQVLWYSKQWGLSSYSRRKDQ